MLRSLLGPVRAEPGCVATHLCFDAGESDALIWAEEWRGTREFEPHLRGPEFRRILAVMELAAALPLDEIDEIVSRRGFELVEQILGKSSAEVSDLEIA